MQDKPLAQKLDEKVFEKLLKYNPQTQNLWDIVGFFEHERAKLRLEVAQYHEEIKQSQATLKTLREEIKKAQNALKDLKSNKYALNDSPQHNALKAQITELELENSKLLVELRDLKSEYKLAQREALQKP
ncbi:hypothetical protein [Helicobacter marmotae]|uniref:Uncharacterized protein n=1 Tax=Helicobacter marmotae TaxID=152490 RepID=A0A3D8I7H0_9HELI|nr:hypothetical protein [Helicobacter marmotae]RDU61099.1 hypothetical protein CQA63_00930 [Helicobacter marmotae]